MEIKKLLLFSFTIFLIAAFTGCSKLYSVGGQGTFTKNNNAGGTFYYNVNSNVKTVKLHLKIRTSKGTLSWVVKDPQGHIRWQENIDGAKNFNETKTFKPIKGQWVLQVGSDKAEGNYEIKWSNK